MAPQSPSQPRSGALPGPTGKFWLLLQKLEDPEAFRAQSVPLSPCRAPCSGLSSGAVDRSQGPALALLTPRSCGESWMFVNPRNGWQNGTAPVLFLGPLEKCRPQSGPARGVHSIFWTPVTRPQPTWPYQGPLLQASSGLGTQGGHRPSSLDPGARLAWVLSELGWAGLAEEGAWRGAGGCSSQALGNISETSRSDVEHFAVYLLPNAGIWEPAEREIRTKCGGGLDRNSGRSRSLTTGPLGSQEPDRCCGGKAVSQTPGCEAEALQLDGAGVSEPQLLTALASGL
ncbi:unnamed protein product [Rangifer tarandus platyrhynchus]|uniref:Uncharacterized protein n=1 Tax=Rangifer tarandus platyrhynchus TaxID=3082113 RepID=A0AC59ZYU1_RANTA